jgi:hypothetical protein
VASGVERRPVSDTEARVASRRWWDGDADAYLGAHGDFLGEVDLLWCPEGLREAEAGLLGPVRSRRVLELGCGAAAGARWLYTAGLALDDLIEPEWPEGHQRSWEQWSPLRGRLFPGTAIFAAHKPDGPR